MGFQHHPDGWIDLNGLRLTLAFFQQQEPAYTLPAGAIRREYVPGVKHILSDGSSQWAGELPWEEGDRYMTNQAQYQAASEAANIAAAASERPSPDYTWNGSSWVLDTPPNWDTFRAQMMSDSAYQTLAISAMTQAQGNFLVTTLQDAISMPSPSIALFAPLWNQIISLVSIKPVAADIDRWNGYASNNHVKLVFQANGTISS